MNTWRKKGYVPDSDDDEDFDSQESRKGYVEEYNTQLGAVACDELQLFGSDGEKNKVHDDKGAGEEEQHRQSVEIGSNVRDDNNDEDRGDQRRDWRRQLEDSDLLDGENNDKVKDNICEQRQLLQSLESALVNGSIAKEDDAALSDDELQVIGIVPTNLVAVHSTNPANGPDDAFISDVEQDSPLSSVPSTLVSPEPSQQAPGMSEDQNSRPQQLGAMQEENLVEENEFSQILTSPIPAIDTEFQPQRRSLRERKEIQKHPYLVEDAKYQSLFRKAGLKPVRVVTAESAVMRSHEESEFIFPRSSPPDVYDPPPSARRQRTPKEKSHLTHDIVHPHSQKRRKLFHDSHVGKHKQQTSSIRVVIEKPGAFVATEFAPPVQAPPSPPRSGRVSSAAHLGKDGFRFPRGFTPPTKTPSSPIQSVSLDTGDITIDDEFQNDTSAGADDVHIFSQSSDEDNEAEETISEIPDMAVRQYQRRIKGVLPASWLTLDLKNKGEKIGESSLNRHQRELYTTRAEPQKGVARPISRPRGTALKSPTPHTTFAFLETSSDSEDAGVDTPDAVDIPLAKEGRKTADNLSDFHDFTNDMDGDIPEDNRLEESFSLVHRSASSHSRYSRSHSSIPKSYKRKQVSYKNNQPQKSRPLRQMRLDDSAPRPPKRKVRKPQIPNLSILDAPDVALLSRKEQPQFLRVATRQARSRKDQGRSSPSRKVFNMATREETKETNKALWDWKKGSMKQAKPSLISTPRGARQPLQSLSTNRSNHTDRNHTSTLLQNSATEDRPRFLEELDLTSGNTPFAQPAALPSAKGRLISTAPKQSKLVRKSVVKRKHAITSLRRDAARPVESEIVSGEGALSPYAFSASLAALRKDRKRTFTLDRYISALDSSGRKPPQSSRSASQTESANLEDPQPVRKKLPRKRAPVHADVIDIDPMPQITASSEPSRSVYTAPLEITTVSSDTLYGFRNYKVFSIDFNVLPIRKGTYFHHSTFIGEGGLSRSLNINKRNMDEDIGFAVIELNHQTFHWSAWTEEVSSELGKFIDTIKSDTVKHDSLPEASSNSDVSQSLVSVIRWITDKLHFIDPVDRIAFIERLELLSCDLQAHITAATHTNEKAWKDHMILASLNMVLANQIRQIASHELVNPSKREGLLNLVKSTSHQLLSLVHTNHGLQNIRHFYEKNQDTKFHESGVRHGYPAVEAHVIVFQILHSTQEFQGCFDKLVLSSFADKASSSNVQHLEEVWEAIFIALPLSEIDEFGLGRPGLRFCDKYDHWPIVQSLISKVLDAYCLDPDQPTFYINYCRIIFQRCLLLIVSFGWRNCKGILETLFDFYAKNMMYNLKTEQSFGSPSFLESLDTNPTIEIEPGDSSFHLFLKILGSGLRYLSHIHNKKMMRNIAWRLLPNHGRVYPKEKPLAHEDLEALRNHHDLLCTLYWAVPNICRPRLQTIRNLIDPATSHLETTNLSIRSWRRLVHFKLSTNEEDADLRPFADWYRSFASEMIRQHQLAKTEVEAQAKNQMQFSKQDVDSTVSHNQRRIEALISSTIAAMESAIQSSRSFSQACLLIEGFPIAKLFELFNPANSRINPIICDGLQLVMSFLSKESPLVNTTVPSTLNDDSQEYGDWSALEEVFNDGITEPAAPAKTSSYLQEVVRPCVFHLLSNCFGEDRSPGDALLMKVTECWSTLAHASVRSGLEHWDSYLNPYSGNSWTALRMTPQTKKYGPQFLANCIENDSQFFSKCRLQILTMWVSCLVERTSALKFQHRLTEVVLNEDQTPLMKNLPYHRGTDGRYHISSSELVERRISLLSSLLSNMREHHQENSGLASTKAIEEYRELIVAMMAAMKTNYQELGQSGKAAQGQYVEFVHGIISFMQQHTQSICPLDRFFTDPSTFPLPPGDPGLVVAKLKGYGVRLPAAKAAKELVNFMQGVCESAALDDKQNDLVDQLCESMCETYESGDTANPTLRSFLFHCLFAAYIECALNNAAAWIFVLPITKAVSQTARDLIYDIDVNDPECVGSVNGMFGAILRAIRHVMHNFLERVDYTEECRAILIVKSCIEMLSATIPVFEYINRNGHSDDHNMAILAELRRHTTTIVDRLFQPSIVMEDQDENPVQEPVDSAYVDSFFLESRTYTIRQVQMYLRTNWSTHDGRYFVRRGRELKEITGTILHSKEVVDVHFAKSSLIETANMFLCRWKSIHQRDLHDYFNASRESNVYDALGEGLNDLLL